MSGHGRGSLQVASSIEGDRRMQFEMGSDTGLKQHPLHSTAQVFFCFLFSLSVRLSLRSLPYRTNPQGLAQPTRKSREEIKPRGEAHNSFLERNISKASISQYKSKFQYRNNAKHTLFAM